MTDNGLAALAAALWRPYDPPNERTGQCNVCGDDGIADFEATDAAAAILGERGVFLPDGLHPTDDYAEIIDRWKAIAEDKERTIATLRAVEKAAQAVVDDWYSGGEIETGRTPFHDALRVALAKAVADPCPHCVMLHEWPCPTIPRCDEPGCEREATCGWPTRPGGTGPNGGYRRTCGDHMRAALAVAKENQ